MELNKSFQTDLIKEIEKKYPDAISLHQDIWMHATEFYMGDMDEPPISKEEVVFLEYAYLVIRAGGEQLGSYSEDELLQVHAMLVSSICLNRADLIEKSGLSKDFVFVVETELERLGHTFM